MIRLIAVLILVLFTAYTWAAGARANLDEAHIDPDDTASLQRGAKNFIDYCFSCHSLAYMRYNRIAKDLTMREEDVNNQLLFTGAKVEDNIENAMRGDDAKRWFGTKPPDLSVVARSRSVDWLYTYLRSFYADPSRPWGVNNAVFKDVAMPHVLWELQGLQKPVFEQGESKSGEKKTVLKEFTLVEKGKLTPQEFDAWVRDTVNFLHYVSEPTKPTRLALGKWVIGFLLIYLVVMYLLKKEYWRDIKK